MPLTRGSAMVGFVSLLGLSLAAGMETMSMIPQGMQVRSGGRAGRWLLGRCEDCTVLTCVDQLVFMACSLLPTAFCLMVVDLSVQVDWESILSPHFHLFNASVAPWFYNASALQPAPFHLPIVQEVFPTTFHVYAALSHDDSEDS